MPKQGLRWNKNAMKQLRQTHESQRFLNQLATEIQQAASDNGRVAGYKVTDLVLEDPRNATSVVATGHARRHNRKHHALVKALDRVAR